MRNLELLCVMHLVRLAQRINRYDSSLLSYDDLCFGDDTPESGNRFFNTVDLVSTALFNLTQLQDPTLQLQKFSILESNKDLPLNTVSATIVDINPQVIQMWDDLQTLPKHPDLQTSSPRHLFHAQFTNVFDSFYCRTFELVPPSSFRHFLGFLLFGSHPLLWALVHDTCQTVTSLHMNMFDYLPSLLPESQHDAQPACRILYLSNIHDWIPDWSDSEEVGQLVMTIHDLNPRFLIASRRDSMSNHPSDCFVGESVALQYRSFVIAASFNGKVS